jgi:outer membrane immunogenic protein
MSAVLHAAAAANWPFGTAQKLPWFGTLRGRVGVTPSDGWLVYATAGLAYGEIKTSATLTVPPGADCVAPCTRTPGGSVAGNFSQTRAGWVVGAGVETALGGHWTGKLEYLHVDFGDISNTFAPIAISPFNGSLRANTRLTDEIMRVGVNYRFGG